MGGGGGGMSSSLWSRGSNPNPPVPPWYQPLWATARRFCCDCFLLSYSAVQYTLCTIYVSREFILCTVSFSWMIFLLFSFKLRLDPLCLNAGSLVHRVATVICLFIITVCIVATQQAVPFYMKLSGWFQRLKRVHRKRVMLLCILPVSEKRRTESTWLCYGRT